MSRLRPALGSTIVQIVVPLLCLASISRAQATSDDVAVPVWQDGSALKLIVDRDGPVVVQAADLVDAGWSLDTIGHRSIVLAESGEERPIWVDDGGDGRFDASDRLLFYGRAMDGEFTRERVYWLRHGEGTPPAERFAPPRDDALPAESFTSTLRWEEDTVYVASQPEAEGPDRWMWGAAISAPSTRSLSIGLPANTVIGASARLTVTLQGYTADPDVDGDHRVRVAFGERVEIDRMFDGRGVHVLGASIAAGRIGPGVHGLDIFNVGDTGAAVDAVFLNRVELDVGARFELVDGRLDFRSPADAGEDSFIGYRLGGLGAGDDPRVWDIGDPDRPIAITGVRRIDAPSDEPDAAHAAFADRATAGRRYLAFSDGAVAPPLRIERNRPSDWRRHADGADWIAISHADFLTEVERLSDHRQRRGWRTAVVDVADIYDEFSHGVYDPVAIRDFVEHAWRTWPKPAPRFLVLVGAATLDHRGGYGPPTRRFVPAPRVPIDPGGDLATVTSDAWYATLEGDDPVPELGVGRLPVATTAEARTVVDKIIEYETESSMLPEPEWRRTTLWVNDDDGADQFVPFNEKLASSVPDGHVTRRFDASSYDRDRDLSADLRAAIDAGALAIHYTGHGNVDLWSPWPGGGPIFSNRDIAELRNGSALPLLTSATCMNGFFDNPVKPISMAELWLAHPDGGGIAAWVPSGFAGLSAQEALLGTLYEGLFDDRGRSLGELTQAAAAAAWASRPGESDIIRMFVLVGDPATVISASAAHGDDVSLHLPILYAADRTAFSAGEAFHGGFDLDGECPRCTIRPAAPRASDAGP